MSLMKMLRPSEVMILTVDNITIKIGLREKGGENAMLDIDAPKEVLISAIARDKIWVGGTKRS